MQVLKFLENRFDELSLKVKCELFIFPLILLAVVFYFFDDNEKNSRKFFSSKIANEKKMDKNILDIVKDIEVLAKDCNIEILNISTSKKRIELEVLASKKKQASFVNSLEYYNSFSKIKELDIEAQRLFLVLDFKKFYVKSEKKEFASTNTIEMNLHAIVNNKAFINKSWFKVNENIGSFRIISISHKKVTLDNGFKIIELSLNEYL